MTTPHQIKQKRLGIKSDRDGEYHRQAVALLELDGGTVAVGVLMRGIEATPSTWTRVKVLLEHDPRVVVTEERIGATGRIQTYRAATRAEQAARVVEPPKPPKPKPAPKPKSKPKAETSKYHPRKRTPVEWHRHWVNAYAHGALKPCRWYRHEVLAHRCGVRAKSADWLRHIDSADVPQWVRVEVREGHLHCMLMLPLDEVGALVELFEKYDPNREMER